MNFVRKTIHIKEFGICEIYHVQTWKYTEQLSGFIYTLHMTKIKFIVLSKFFSASFNFLWFCKALSLHWSYTQMPPLNVFVGAFNSALNSKKKTTISLIYLTRNDWSNDVSKPKRSA